MKLKISRLIVVTTLLGLIFTSGCSQFKTSKSRSSGATTMGYEVDDSFGGENDVLRKNQLKPAYDQFYFFSYDNYEVKATDYESIDIQANYLVNHPHASVRLEGNTDERGSREYNVALGWKRAKAVAALLKERGVSESQIAIVSYGKERPIALGNNEAAHSKNRRVDLIYEAK